MTSFTHFPLPAKEILSARRPSWGVTNIQSSPYFLESRAAFTAMALRDYFLHGSFARSDKHVPEETKQQAGAVKELFRSSCGAEAQNRAVGSLFAVSMAMIPYLTPSELGEVWRTLEKGPCTASFTPRIQQLVSLFKAMSRRDTRSMSLSAKKMLEESDTMTPSTVKYIASTAILGFLGQDDREAAAEVWNTHRAFLSGDNNPDLLMQLLAAEIR